LQVAEPKAYLLVAALAAFGLQLYNLTPRLPQPKAYLLVAALAK
jgi:hypothetical protein